MPSFYQNLTTLLANNFGNTLAMAFPVVEPNGFSTVCKLRNPPLQFWNHQNSSPPRHIDILETGTMPNRPALSKALRQRHRHPSTMPEMATTLKTRLTVMLKNATGEIWPDRWAHLPKWLCGVESLASFVTSPLPWPLPSSN